MTYTSAIESNAPPAIDPSVSAIPASTRTTGSARSTPPAPVASDSASVSLAGVMLSQASQGGDVRFDKVAALRQAIDAGSYNIPSANLAAKLVDTLQH